VTEYARRGRDRAEHLVRVDLRRGRPERLGVARVGAGITGEFEVVPQPGEVVEPDQPGLALFVALFVGGAGQAEGVLDGYCWSASSRCRASGALVAQGAGEEQVVFVDHLGLAAAVVAACGGGLLAFEGFSRM
jgi:hypothetical protein